MRINVYAEELPEINETRSIERVEKDTPGGKFFGLRLYLKSADELHNTPDDDDRSAITIWGPKHKVATLLRFMANMMDGADDRLPGPKGG